MKSILEVGLGPLAFLSALVSGDDKNKAKSVAKALGAAGDTVRGLDTKRVMNAPFLKGSISNYANDLIMTFPMLIDNSLDPEICSMLSKANERNIVTMLQLLFSSEQINGNSGRDIINLIYGKVKPNVDVDDYIDAMDRFVASAESYNPGFIEMSVAENALVRDTIKAICEAVSEEKFAFTEESLNERSLNDFEVTFDRNGDSVVNELKSSWENKYYRNPPQRAQTINNYYVGDPSPDPNGDSKSADYMFNSNGFYQPTPSSILMKDDIRNYNDVHYKEWQMKQAADKAKADKDNLANQMTKDREKEKTDLIPRQILDTDVKKANELQPTMLMVQYNELDTNGTIYDRRTFVCGVKSRVIPVDPSDIIDRIVVKNKTKLSFVNFIRATTGEIGFLKDFVFNITQAKIDAKNSVKKGEAAQMWKALEAMSTRNNINKMRKAGNDASAITTLVINKETANLLKKQFKIDIEQPRIAKALLEDYNLLGLFIVDESIEVVKVLYRGNAMFEQQAFSFLEREANDKSYKKVINLMGQMNRGY